MSAPLLSLTDAELEALAAEDVIRWSHGEFGERVCLSCSWQKQSSVLVHMLAELGLGIDVVELDTHLFFRETYETRERLVERYGLTLICPEVNLGNIPPEEVVPLETLRLGLRADTLKEVLLRDEPAPVAD